MLQLLYESSVDASSSSSVQQLHFTEWTTVVLKTARLQLNSCVYVCVWLTLLLELLLLRTATCWSVRLAMIEYRSTFLSSVD
jgi:hypothetical protein